MVEDANGMKRFLAHLDSRELLLSMTWEEWLSVTPPYQDVKFSTEEVTVRFARYSYEWEMIGTCF